MVIISRYFVTDGKCLSNTNFQNFISNLFLFLCDERRFINDVIVTDHVFFNFSCLKKVLNDNFQTRFSNI